MSDESKDAKTALVLASTSETPRLDAAAISYEGATWLRALIQAIPTVGGSIDTLLARRGATLQQERIERMLLALQEEVGARAEQEIGKEYFASDEFLISFKQMLERSACEADKKHVDLLAAALANSCDPELWEESRPRIVLATIRALTPDHVVALKFVASKQGHVEPGHGDATPVSIEDARHLFPGMLSAMVKSIMLDLMNLGLVNDWGIGRYDYTGPDRFYINGYGLLVLRYLRSRRSENCSTT